MHACKILLADNNIGDQYLLKELVKQLNRNWRVHVVPSGRQLLRYLNHLTRADYPELILMDYALPSTGAPAVIERLTNDPRYKSIPKFVWSAAQLPEGIETSLRSGAVDILPKPARASEAKALVSRLLSAC